MDQLCGDGRRSGAVMLVISCPSARRVLWDFEAGEGHRVGMEHVNASTTTEHCAVQRKSWDGRVGQQQGTGTTSGKVIEPTRNDNARDGLPATGCAGDENRRKQ